MSKKGKILEYCNRKHISLNGLAKITGASYSLLRGLSTHPEKNITLDTANKLYVGTLKMYPNDPLTPDIYSDLELFQFDEDSENQNQEVEDLRDNSGPEDAVLED